MRDWFLYRFRRGGAAGSSILHSPSARVLNHIIYGPCTENAIHTLIFQVVTFRTVLPDDSKTGPTTPVDFPTLKETDDKEIVRVLILATVYWISEIRFLDTGFSSFFHNRSV